MIKETMNKIEKKISESANISDNHKKEYLDLFKTLKEEIGELSKTEKDQALSITGFAGLSTHEASRQDVGKVLLDISIDGFKKSVEGFETSNPRLVSIVNSFCTMLSNIGI